MLSFPDFFLLKACKQAIDICLRWRGLIIGGWKWGVETGDKSSGFLNIFVIGKGCVCRDIARWSSNTFISLHFLRYVISPLSYLFRKRKLSRYTFRFCDKFWIIVVLEVADMKTKSETVNLLMSFISLQGECLLLQIFHDFRLFSKTGVSLNPYIFKCTFFSFKYIIPLRHVRFQKFFINKLTFPFLWADTIEH